MSPDFGFAVLTTPAFERSARKLSRHHKRFVEDLSKAIAVLEKDPLNADGTHDIRKLSGASKGDGQFRLRIGRWQFRYDIYRDRVLLVYCGLRREDTYR